MKQLLLLRHADALGGSPDHDRTLSNIGINEAEKIADFLIYEQFQIDHIYTSSATRTKQTTEIIANKFPLATSEAIPSLYHSTLQQYIYTLSNTNNNIQNLLVVGHNPAINEILNYLCDTHIYIYPSCGLSILKYKHNDWKEINHKTCDLELFISPQKLK